MKIIALNIENFRGIRNVRANALGNTIIIAGQNGSGKSCIFDSIRLLKSVYGGYQQNEWHQWMGEFAINVNSPNQDLIGIFNQKHLPVTIECHFELHDDEKGYFTRNIDELLVDAVWRMELPDAYAYGGYRMAMFAAQMREKEPQVRARAAELRPILEAELVDRI
jgi:predicted ATP-dependent endonuclease of OLD family